MGIKVSDLHNIKEKGAGPCLSVHTMLRVRAGDSIAARLFSDASPALIGDREPTNPAVDEMQLSRQELWTHIF